LFSSSLSGPAFSWFTWLPANSIIEWSDLEQQFHNYFFSGIHEMKITNLTRLKQRNDETLSGFVQRFREVRNKCYSLNLGDKQLAELAFQGLLPTLSEKYASHDFESLSSWLVGWVRKLQSLMSLEGTFRGRYLMWTTLTQKMKTIW
jgi:hypothetical protein